jgi:poly-gamma-glutamate capsule biosynthesis protein CapA/YwtB (metallophosphatase superfamily)
MKTYIVAALLAAFNLFGQLTSFAAETRTATVPPLRITFVGDVCFDGNPGHAVVKGEDPFAAVAALLKDSDLAVANLECAVVTAGTMGRNGYTFKAPVECVPVLKRYFSAVSVANNHSGDWGREGFLSEIDVLERAKLPYFGGGRNLEQARRPAILVSHGRRVALLGYCNYPPRRYAALRDAPGTAWLVENDVLADIRLVRTRDKADIVIPYLHWGVEHLRGPEEDQAKLARKMIEAGADAVIGAHPHISQTVDWYRGKPIVYSLGNFVFNYYPHDPAVYYGWVVRITFDGTGVSEMKTSVVKIEPTGLPRPITADDRDHL